MEKHIKWLAVTGGSKGIGKAVIEAFMEEGFHAITCARNLSELNQVKQELELKYKGRKLLTISADLSKAEDCQRFTDFVKEHVTSLDVLVNNAGYFLPGQIQNEPEGTLESMMEANVYSAYRVTRSLLSIVKSGSQLFTVCSTASIIPYVNGGSYCISKHALLGFTKVLREELKTTGVRVTAILPGATLTASWEGVDLPKERFMKPEDVGQAILGCWKLSHQTVVEELLLRPQLGDI